MVQYFHFKMLEINVKYRNTMKLSDYLIELSLALQKKSVNWIYTNYASKTVFTIKTSNFSKMGQ